MYGWAWVELNLIPEFLYKTQLARSRAQKPKVMMVPGLKPEALGDSTEEKALCPTRHFTLRHIPLGMYQV